ncbi:hypothetical protein ACQY0O_004620 [Thecaphora frezii]
MELLVLPLRRRQEASAFGDSVDSTAAGARREAWPAVTTLAARRDFLPARRRPATSAARAVMPRMSAHRSSLSLLCHVFRNLGAGKGPTLGASQISPLGDAHAAPASSASDRGPRRKAIDVRRGFH